MYKLIILLFLFTSNICNGQIKRDEQTISSATVESDNKPPESTQGFIDKYTITLIGLIFCVSGSLKLRQEIRRNRILRIIK